MSGIVPPTTSDTSSLFNLRNELLLCKNARPIRSTNHWITHFIRIPWWFPSPGFSFFRLSHFLVNGMNCVYDISNLSLRGTEYLLCPNAYWEMDKLSPLEFLFLFLWIFCTFTSLQHPYPVRYFVFDSLHLPPHVLSLDKSSGLLILQCSHFLSRLTYFCCPHEVISHGTLSVKSCHKWPCFLHTTHVWAHYKMS